MLQCCVILTCLKWKASFTDWRWKSRHSESVIGSAATCKTNRPQKNYTDSQQKKFSFLLSSEIARNDAVQRRCSQCGCLGRGHWSQTSIEGWHSFNPSVVVQRYFSSQTRVSVNMLWKCYFLSSSICCLLSMAPSPHRRWSIMATTSSHDSSSTSSRRYERQRTRLKFGEHSFSCGWTKSLEQSNIITAWTYWH